MAAPFRIVIPARFASTRLPGKPLRDLAGKPVVQWAWENAMQAGAHEVVVATDDTRIADAVRAFGGDVCLTSAAHLSGTDRLAEVSLQREYGNEDIVVNLQGDEPSVSPQLLGLVARALELAPTAGIATLATPIHSVGDLFEESVVKVVLDTNGFALTFSRAPIPWVRGAFGTGSATHLPDGVPFLRHIGLYAYRAGTLRSLAGQSPTALEQAEALEQLRAIENGIRIHVSVIVEAPAHGIDTEEDLRRAALYFAGAN